MKSVLTVDDSPSIRLAIKVTLGRGGYEFMQAEDGVDGLSKAKSKAVNRVITALNKPRMDGMTSIEQLRPLPGHNGVPILVLTTESDAGVKTELRRVVSSRDARIGLVVDRIIGNHQTVIKSLSKLQSDVQSFSGARILGDGSVALIFDVPQLIAVGQSREQSRNQARREAA